MSKKGNAKIISEFSSNKIVYNHEITKNPDKNMFSTHFHEFIEVIYFISGNASYIVDGKKYKLRPNDIVLAKPLQYHYIEIEEDEPYERYDILISEKLLPSDFLKKMPTTFEYFSAENNDILNIFNKFDTFTREFEAQDLKQILHSLAVELMYVISLQSRNTTIEHPTKHNSIIEKAIHYINKNLTTISSVDEICNHLFLSKSHFHHLFLEIMHTSPMNFVRSKRLILAKLKIENGEKPTKIYSDCGFLDYTTFYRAYKQQFGYKPAEYNRQNKNKIQS